jgi:hypothetical protein
MPGRRSWRRPPRRGVVDHVRSWRFEPLTPSVAPRALRARLVAEIERDRSRSARADSAAPSSKSAASATQDAFHRRVLPAAHFREPRGNPPPISRFCHRRVGFRHVFTAPTLSRGPARPAVEFASSSLASAEGHVPLVDFCNRTTIHEHDQRSSEPRAPPQSRLYGQHHVTGGRTHKAHSQPRGHGPGAGLAFADPAPPCAIARARSFAPTRSP